MDIQELKSAVSHITLPEEAEARIIRNCASSVLSRKEDFSMKKYTNFTKPITLAAVLVMCLCLTFTAAASGGKGQFKDILGFGGAVVGTTYENATQEIQVDAAIADDRILLTVTFTDPGVFPYRELENLTLGDYQLIDAQSKIIASAMDIEPAAIENGQVTLSIPLNGTDCSGCELTITSFIGSKKAEQPLPITGNWNCPLA